MWEEFLSADTHAKGKGSTVAKVLDGSVHPYPVTGMASVTNPGLDANWCGHHFSQANWYACGRLSWNPELSAAQIAGEWTRLTFSNDDKVVAVIVGGLASIEGSILGAAFVILVPALLSETRWMVPVLFGVAIIVVLVLEPLGLAGRWLKTRLYFQLWPFR